MTVFDPRSVVAAKRDGKPLPEEDLRLFIEGYVSGTVPEYLASAFLMAGYIRGFDLSETVAMTRAMVASGGEVPLSRISRAKVDKHSTGGVGDGVTLVFAPMVAALGLAAAKLSGRALGHTGGTLDKLESIPGLRTDLSAEEFERQVEEVGCAVAAQGPDLVPADRALYSLRDATATVGAPPLIAASVMCKKLALGTDLVLLDVKAGSGAFMKTPEAASELARLCVEVARSWGRPAAAVITDMSQPLGNSVGNALDVAEAVSILGGGGPGRLRDLAVRLASEALRRAERTGLGEATSRAEGALADGSALERFARMVEAQGGDPRVTDDPAHVLPRAPVVEPVLAEAGGYVRAVEAETIGRASVALGAGRARKDEPIDPSVGIVVRPKIGERVEPGEEIAMIHARDAEAAGAAGRAVLGALTLSETPVEAPPLVHEWVEWIE